MSEEQQHDFHYETNPITQLIEGVKRSLSTSTTLAVATLLAPFVYAFVQIIFQLFTSSFNIVNRNPNNRSIAFLVIGVFLMICAAVFMALLQVFIAGLAALTGVMSTRGEDRPIGAAASEILDKFWRMFGISFVIGLYILPYVFLACLIGGVLFAVGAANHSLIPILVLFGVVSAIGVLFGVVRISLRYSLAPFALFDRNSSVMASLKQSKKLTKGRLMEVFGIRSLGGIVPILGILLVTTAQAQLYRQLVYAREEHNLTLPKESLLNYLGIALFVGLIMFFSLFVLLLIGLSSVGR